MSKSTLDVTTLQFDDTGNPILLTSSSNNLDLQGTAAADITLSGVAGITATNNINIISGNTTNQGTFATVTTVTTDSTAGNLVYTASQVYNGIFNRDPNGANRSDTFPTAASIIGLINNAADNDIFKFILSNTANANENITLTAGTGITISGNNVVEQGEVAEFIGLVTSVGSNTITMYNVGSSGGTRNFITIRGTLSNFSTTTNRYAQWSGISVGNEDTLVNNFMIGYDGIIRSVGFTFLNGTAFTAAAGANQVAFNLGSTSGDPNAGNFTAFTGGSSVVIWDNAEDATWPSETNDTLNISVTSTTQIAVQSIVTGTVTPITGEINVVLVIELL